MSNAPAVLVDIFIGVSALSALATVITGIRKHADDAAALPVSLSQKAVSQASIAMEFEERRLDILTASESKLRTELAEAKGTIEAQQKQITTLQSKMYELQAERTDLIARADVAERRAQEATERLTTLEAQFETLKRKFELGPI